MQLLGGAFRNPWVRLWIVLSVVLAVYWYVDRIGPLVDDYQRIDAQDRLSLTQEGTRFFIGDYYEGGQLDVFLKDQQDNYSPVHSIPPTSGMSSTGFDFSYRGQCSLPKGIVDCLELSEKPTLTDDSTIQLFPEFITMRRAATTDEDRADAISRTCWLRNWWRGRDFATGPSPDDPPIRRNPVNPNGTEAIRTCIDEFHERALARHQADVNSAKSVVFRRLGDQFLPFLSALLATALAVAACAWVVRGFRNAGH